MKEAKNPKLSYKIMNMFITKKKHELILIVDVKNKSKLYQSTVSIEKLYDLS